MATGIFSLGDDIPKSLLLRKNAGKNIINSFNKKENNEIWNIDDWDKSNQIKLNQLVDNWHDDLQLLYEKLKTLRNQERKQMENRGLVDRQDVRKSLDDAITFKGTCQDMCPVFERIRREVQNEVKIYEKNPSSGKPCIEYCVKAFSRPAAGQPPPLPSDVRPPKVLKRTLDYLIHNIVPQLPASHAFLWDRTRSIRQDFTYQNYSGQLAIECCEKIARIHILSLHIMSGADDPDYSIQQELEQLHKTLQSLSEMYDDSRANNISYPNEPEFRAYQILCHLQDPEIDQLIQCLPYKILSNPLMKIAINLRKLSQVQLMSSGEIVSATGMFYSFFQLVFNPETPYLFACILESKFADIRITALRSMSRCYHRKGKPYPAERLMSMLGFENQTLLIDFCSSCHLNIVDDNNTLCIDLSTWSESELSDKPPSKIAYSTKTESLRKNQSLESIIYGSYLDQSDLQINETTSSYPFSQNQSAKNIPNFSSISQKSTLQSFSSHPFEFKKTENAFSSPFSLNKKDSPQSSATVGSTGSLSGFATNNLFSSNKSPSSISALPVNQKRPSSFGSLSSSPFKKIEQHTSNANPFASAAQPQTQPQPFLTSRPSSQRSQFQFSNSIGNNLQANPLVKENNVENTAFNKENFLFKNSTSNDKQLPKLFKTDLKPSTDYSPTNILSQNIENPQPANPQPAIKPVEVKPKQLSSTEKDLVSKNASNELINNFVKKESRRIVQDAVKQYNLQVERRKKFINNTAECLFNSLVKEYCWIVLQEAKADNFKTNSMLIRIIQLIKKTAIISLERKEYRRRKAEEYNEAISLLGKPLLRSKSNSFSNSKKGLKTENGDDIAKRLDSTREKMLSFWSPLELSYLFKQILKSINTNPLAERKASILFWAENWDNSSSNWVASKFGLKYQQEIGLGRVENYENCTINFKTISSKNVHFDYNTLFFVFECGLSNNNQDINEKLKYDVKVLFELFKQISRHSWYKISVVILYWESPIISLEEAYKILRIRELEKKFSEVILSIKLLPIGSIEDCNIESTMKSVASHHKLEYTFLGKDYFDKKQQDIDDQLLLQRSKKRKLGTRELFTNRKYEALKKRFSYFTTKNILVDKNGNYNKEKSTIPEKPNLFMTHDNTDKNSSQETLSGSVKNLLDLIGDVKARFNDI